MKAFTLVLPLALTTGCTLFGAGAHSANTDTLAHIQAESRKTYGQEPDAIYQYEYKGATVFLTVPPCCDQYATLYSAEGKPLCSPRGGFAGNGDGTCPDFEDEKKNEKIVFKKTSVERAP